MTNSTNTEKLRELAMAVLQAAPNQQLNIVQLNKALFYIDLIALRDLGETASGQRYVALPQGPVVDGYQQRIVEALTEMGLAEQLHIGKAKPLRVVKQIDRFEHIDQGVLDIAKQIGHAFAKYTSTFLSDYSHHNPGWDLARKSGRPAQEINLRIALQQLNDGDDEDPDDDEQAFDAELRDRATEAHLATDLWK